MGPPSFDKMGKIWTVESLCRLHFPCCSGHVFSVADNNGIHTVVRFVCSNVLCFAAVKGLRSVLVAIHSCIVASGWVLRSKTWTCDFEAGLLKAMKEQFPEGCAVGCLFHWKQSLRRKLMELNVSLEKISELMWEDGLINLLTVLPLSEIVNKAIPFIRANFDEGKFSKQFDKSGHILQGIGYMAWISMK